MGTDRDFAQRVGDSVRRRFAPPPPAAVQPTIPWEGRENPELRAIAWLERVAGLLAAARSRGDRQALADHARLLVAHTPDVARTLGVELSADDARDWALRELTELVRSQTAEIRRLRAELRGGHWFTDEAPGDPNDDRVVGSLATACGSYLARIAELEDEVARLRAMVPPGEVRSDD